MYRLWELRRRRPGGTVKETYRGARGGKERERENKAVENVRERERDGETRWSFYLSLWASPLVSLRPW